MITASKADFVSSCKLVFFIRIFVRVIIYVLYGERKNAVSVSVGRIYNGLDESSSDSSVVGD